MKRSFLLAALSVLLFGGLIAALPPSAEAASVSPATSSSWSAFDLTTAWGWASSVYLLSPAGLNLESPGKTSIAGTQSLTAYGFATYTTPGVYTVLEAFGSYTCTVGESLSSCESTASAASGGFISAGTFDFTGAPSPAAALAFPTNGTTTPDFSNWVVSVSNPSSTIGGVGVRYGFSTSSWSYDDHSSYAPFVSVNPFEIRKTQPLWFIPLAIPATWYAQPYLIEGTTTVPGTIISFSVDPNAPAPASTTLAGPFFTTIGGETSSTLANPTTDCSFTSSSILADPVGNIQTGICQAFVFLFIPNSAQQQNIQLISSGTFGAIAPKPPFGYFNIAVADFNSFSASTTASTTLMSSSTAAYLAVVTGPLDSGLASTISFLLFMWAFNRFRHFEPT